MKNSTWEIWAARYGYPSIGGEEIAFYRHSSNAGQLDTIEAVAKSGTRYRLVRRPDSAAAWEEVDEFEEWVKEEQAKKKWADEVLGDRY